MQGKVTLRVIGVSLDDEETIERIATYLDDLVWTVVDNRVRATVIVANHAELVSKAVEAARRIEHCLTGSRVDRIDEELVGVPDIAARVGLNRETVRSWTIGSRGPGGFPNPIGSVGGGERGAAKIWRWADVNVWLDLNYSLGDGCSYASDSEFAEISAYLARADYMVVAHVQNGPPAITGPSYARSVGARTRGTFTVTSKDSMTLSYFQTSQFIGA